MTSVYFIRPIGSDGPIKIGCTKHPQKRLVEYLRWSPVPLEVIVTVPGSFKLERNIHSCFSDLHSHHEWFRADPRLTRAIAKLLDGVPVESAIDLNDRRGAIHGPGAPKGVFFRTKMSFLHRMRGAAGRAGLSYLGVPEVAASIFKEINQRAPTASETALIEGIIARPELHFLPKRREAA